MRVVLDTNIIVSSYLVTVGAPARILAAWRAGWFALIISNALLAEYEQILNRPRIRRRHGFTAEQIAEEMKAFREEGIFVQPWEVPAVIADDPDDGQVLAAAVAGEAGYIVSGDPHLLRLREYRGIRILTPAAFVLFLDETIGLC